MAAATASSAARKGSASVAAKTAGSAAACGSMRGELEVVRVLDPDVDVLDDEIVAQQALPRLGPVVEGRRQRLPSIEGRQGRSDPLQGRQARSVASPPSGPAGDGP